MPSLESTVRRFAGTDRDTRLQLLLDYAEKLPELPDRFRAARDQGAGRVPECQTPVFLWMEREGDRVTLYADVARESPTVRGFVGLLKRQVDGMTPAEVMALPNDLLDQLKLSELLGMTRIQGLTAVLGRVRRMAGDGG